MDDNSLSIDLKKLRKNLPPPPVAVAPLSSQLDMAPAPAPSRITVPPPAPVQRSMSAPPMRRIDAPSGTKMRRFSAKHLALGLVSACLVLGGGYYIYRNIWTKSPFGPTEGSIPAQSAAASTSTSSTELTETQIIEAVGKLMLLPKDETPTLAKVSDPALLQSQAFFKNAAVGDVVLMYPRSLRAILFDPTQNKIIEVGPITDATSSPATTTPK